MNEGYIQLHRKMLKWEWYDDANTFRLFMHLLLNANYKASRYRGYDVPAGACVTGYTSLSKQLGISVQSIRTAMAKLKSTGEVTVNKTNKFSIVSMVRWSDYQSTNRQSNTQSTLNQHSTNTQLTPSKEGNKVIKKKEPIAQSNFDTFWSCYPRKKSKGVAEKVWNKGNLGNGTFDLIMDGLERAKASEDWQKDGGKWIPYPSTWLNAKGWEDEFEASGNSRPRNLL